MIDDFGTPVIDATYDAAHKTSQILKIFSFGQNLHLSPAALYNSLTCPTVLGAVAPIAKEGEVVFTLASSAFDLASEKTADGDTKADIRQGYKTALENTLSHVFIQGREGLQDLAASAFGAQDPCHFSGSGGNCGLRIAAKDTPIASIFLNGRYLLLSGQDPLTSLPTGTFDPGLQKMVRTLGTSYFANPSKRTIQKQYLVGQLLKDLGDYIWVNVSSHFPTLPTPPPNPTPSKTKRNQTATQAKAPTAGSTA